MAASLIDRFIVKQMTGSTYFGILDAAKDDWATHQITNRFGVRETVRYCFTHQEAAQYKAEILNYKERKEEDGE